MAVIDNTQAFPYGGPLLGGMGASTDMVSTDFGSSIDFSNPQIAVPAVNAEATFLTNLLRQARGLPPVSTQQSAPAVNVGLDQGTKDFLLYAGLGILAVLILSRKRKG